MRSSVPYLSVPLSGILGRNEVKSRTPLGLALPSRVPIGTELLI